MATRKPAAKSTPKNTARASRAPAAKSATRKEVLDVASLYSDTIDVIERRQGVDTSSLDVAPPMSTGMLQVDMILGGGIRACMLTSAGNEQCAKTTVALTAMANIIKEDVPTIAFVDYEGCFTYDTKISVGGQHVPLYKLVDLSKVSTAGFQPQFASVDTVIAYGSGTKLRTAQLYYKGMREITRVRTSGGHVLEGHGHMMFVWNPQFQRFAEVRMENLLVGEIVMVHRGKMPKEEWQPVNLNAFTRANYLASSYGKVQSATYHSVVKHVPSLPDFNAKIRLEPGHSAIAMPSAYGNTTVQLTSYDGGPAIYVPLKQVIYSAFNTTKFSTASIGFHDCNASNYSIHNLKLAHQGDTARHSMVPPPRLLPDQARALELLANSTSKKDWPQICFSENIARLASYVKGRKRSTYETAHVVPVIPTDLEQMLANYEFVVVTEVSKTGRKYRVYDLSLIGVEGDVLPHSIITNGIVTHNSTKNSKPYVQAILKGAGIKLSVDQVFGKKDNKTGNWVTPPRVRYRNETILERFYDWLSQILRELPDKRYVAGSWWLVFDEKNKKHVAKVSAYADKTMRAKYGGGLWVPAPNDKIQGIVFLDSYTAMNPESKDEESTSNQLSVKASAFSKQLERVKGRMADKMVTVWGLNHLRSNPMAMFGPKETEKGGEALKQFSDVRLRQTSRSLSGPKAYFSPKPGKKGGEKTYNEIENSVEVAGGKDEYRYVHVKAVKNKLWTPERTGWVRIWVEDGNGVARGIDPFFDVMAYLKDTGQVRGNRSALTLKLEGLGVAKKSLTWDECKRWVLGTKEEMVAVSTKCGFKPMSLRVFCFKQMRTGVAETLFVARRLAKDADKTEKESDSDENSVD